MVLKSVVFAFAILFYICNANKLHYSILEEKPAGTVIGNVRKDLNLTAKYSLEVIRQMHFHLLIKETDLFTIDNSAALKTLQPLDKERLCFNRHQTCIIRGDIVTFPLAYFHIVQVFIEIIDINDNSPVFPIDSLTLNALESLSVGAEFYVPAAIDLDSSAYGTVKYKLHLSSDEFILVQRKSPDGGINIRLKLAKKLDWLKQKSYEGQIVAYDGGSPPRIGQLNITINVIDTDDHVPVFEKSIYNISITENSEFPKELIRVFAEDPDSGLFGSIVYGLLEETLQRYQGIFLMDNMTGALILISNLDYETTSTYYLTATARDQGPSLQIAEASIIINVVDVNDNAPMIVINALHALNVSRVGIEENALLGSFVAVVEVRDLDSGSNGEVDCSLSSSDFALKWIYGSVYKLVTNRSLDREEIEAFTVHVLCCDRGLTPLCSFKELLINVADVNDNRPVFSRSTYVANVTENEQQDYVLRVSATDIDFERNAEIEYFLQSPTTSFAIDSLSGILSIVHPLDREEMAYISLTVVARDNGQPRLSSAASVVINIIDVNDELPAFTQPVFNFTITENNEPGVFIGIISAEDRDGPPYNLFTIVLPDEMSELFSVESTTGRLFATQSFDREEQEYYRFIAIVQDYWLNQMGPRGTAVVQIKIQDVNDNSPSIYLPGVLRDVVFVPEKLSVGALAIEVQVIDPDIGVNGKTTIDLMSSADCFVLDMSGTAVVVSKPLFSSSCQHEKGTILSFTATDQGQPQFSVCRNITLYINQTVDNSSLLSFFSENVGSTVLILVVFFVIVVILLLTLLIVQVRRRRQFNIAHQGHVRGRSSCLVFGCWAESTSPHGKHPRLSLFSHRSYAEKVKQTPEKPQRVPRQRDYSFSPESSLASEPSRQSWPSSINFSFLKWPLAWSTRLPGSSSYEFPSPTSVSSDRLLEDVENNGIAIYKRSNLKQRTESGTSLQSSAASGEITTKRVAGRRGSARSVRFIVPEEKTYHQQSLEDVEIDVSHTQATENKTFSQPLFKSTPRSPTISSTVSDGIDGTLAELLPQRLALNTAFVECSSSSTEEQEHLEKLENSLSRPHQVIINVDENQLPDVRLDSPVAKMFDQAPSKLLVNRQVNASPLTIGQVNASLQSAPIKSFLVTRLLRPSTSNSDICTEAGNLETGSLEEGDLVYSCTDIDEVFDVAKNVVLSPNINDISTTDSGVTKGTNSGSDVTDEKKTMPKREDDEGATVSLSGTSSVDAAELCDEINRLFFDDYV